ncbi:MAG: DNA-binding protein, partial [Clostridia bacterium]|nr:DNA-binding protein [Clostridia bacterium]
MLGISLNALDLARAAGAITFVQYVPNGNVFFTEEALLEYVAKCTHQAVPESRKMTYRKQWVNKK